MTVKEATINIALMEYVTEEEGDILKPVRGSSLPLKIKTDARYDEVLEAALKKREDFDHKFSQTMHRGYVLAYPDSRIAKKMPGTSDGNRSFRLQVVLPTSRFAYTLVDSPTRSKSFRLQ